MLSASRKQNKTLELQVRFLKLIPAYLLFINQTGRHQILNHRRKETRARNKITDYQRLVMLMSEHKIAGVSRILSVALRNGASARMIHSRLESALEGTYGPRSGWTEKEIDVAFVIKSYGGSRLLFTMQKEDAYPS